MRVIGLLIALLFSSGPAGAQVKGAPIIDMHLHAFHADPTGTPRPFWLPPTLSSPASDGELMRASLEAGLSRSLLRIE